MCVIVYLYTETVLSVEEEQEMNNLIVEAELAAQILNQEDNQPCTAPDKTQCARDKIKKMYKKFKAAITPIEGTAKFSAHFVAFLLTNKIFENMFHKKLSRMAVNAYSKFIKKISDPKFVEDIANKKTDLQQFLYELNNEATGFGKATSKRKPTFKKAVKRNASVQKLKVSAKTKANTSVKKLKVSAKTKATVKKATCTPKRKTTGIATPKRKRSVKKSTVKPSAKQKNCQKATNSHKATKSQKAIKLRPVARRKSHHK